MTPQSQQDRRRSLGSRMLREPLLHFLLAGAAIFGIYSAVRGPAAPESRSRRIRITAADVEQLRRGWFSQWQRMPSASELQDLIALRIREEVLSREAVKIGLDRDDVIVRRRLAQKFDFLTQDLIAVREPSDAELNTYLAAHADRYRMRSLLHFSQIYFSQDRGRLNPEEDARAALAELRSGADPWTLGDPSVLEAEVGDRTEDEVARQFGGAFATGVAGLEPGTWTGPIRSLYGWHLVRASARTPGRAPKLAEVRDLVARDWAEEQRRAANEDLTQRLRNLYDITIEPDPLAAEPEAGPREARQ